MINKKEILKKLGNYRRLLKTKKYNVIYIGVYGSQNYNLADKKSDLDVKAIVLPTFEDFVNRTKISLVIPTQDGEIVVQDIWTFYEHLTQGHPAWLEPIYSEYFVGNKELKELFKKVPLNYRCVKGMAGAKLAALDHPYDSKKEVLKKFGYDPKQLHHIIRLYDLLNKHISESYTKPFYEYPDDENSFLIGIKRIGDFHQNNKSIPVKEARELANEYFNKIVNLIPKGYKYNFVEDKEIKDYIFNLIKNSLRQELFDSNSEMSCEYFRTFSNPIPKKDLRDFPILEKYQGKDVAYWIYKSIDLEVKDNKDNNK